MGNMPPGMGGDAGNNNNSTNENNKDDKGAKKKKRFEPRPTARQGRRRRRKGPTGLNKTPTIVPNSKCKLRMLKLDRVKDFLLLEEEFIRNHEVFKPAEERDQEEREKLEELRGTPLGVGSLEELIDDNHAIISSSVGPEYYVNILSSVNQDLLEPGSSILFHNKTMSVVGILQDDTDPMVSGKYLLCDGEKCFRVHSFQYFLYSFDLCVSQS
jgi:26S proteasome regulatory subunit T2